MNNKKNITTEKDNEKFNKGALIDLIIIMGTLVIVKQSLLPFTMLYAGPVSTFTAMIVATFLLWRRGFAWGDLGLNWPQSWSKMLIQTIITLAAFFTAIIIMGAIADLFFENVGASGRFDHVEGNLLAYIGMLILVWTHGSFFEELLFRAFIITKASHFLGGGLKADLIAAVFSSVFFGYRHYYYQGMHGALVTGAAGLAFALLYIWFGRKNILPLIIAHGSINTLAQTLRFLGVKDS